MRPCRALRVRAVRAYLCAPPPPQTSAAAAHGHATSSAAAHRNDGRVSAARRRATALVQAAQQRSSRRRQQQQQHRHVTATRATVDDAAAVATAALDAAASLGRSACLLAHAHKRPSCNNDNNNDDDDDASAEALLRRVDDAWQGGGGEAKLQWVCATPRGRTALRTLHAATTTMTTSTAAAAASSHDATLVDYVAHMQPTSSTLWRPPSGTSSLSSPLPRDNNDDDIDGNDVDATTAAVTRRLDEARERQERRCWKQQVWSMLGADAALAYSVDVKDLQQCNNNSNSNSNSNNTATATHTRSSDVTSDAAFARLCRDLGVGVSARRAYVMRRLLPYLDAHDDSATPSLAHVRARARALCDEYDARTRQHTDNNDDNDNHEVATTALDDERDALRDKLAAFQARLPALQRLVESMSK